MSKRAVPRPTLKDSLTRFCSMVASASFAVSALYRSEPKSASWISFLRRLMKSLSPEDVVMLRPSSRSTSGLTMNLTVVPSISLESCSMSLYASAVSTDMAIFSLSTATPLILPSRIYSAIREAMERRRASSTLRSMGWSVM